MGNSKSQLTKSELQYYKELTYLTEREIQYAFKRFKNLHPRILNKNKLARIPVEIIKRMPEFQNNPFTDRICEIFSSENDGLWSFEDFLDMVSVFSPATPPEKKAEYAFCIYDFDGDGFLSKEDLTKLITALTAGEILTEEDIQVVVDKTMEEADIDKDGMLSPGEFKHVLLKCPDFARSFAIRI
ncbi:calcium and integrin-binding protein 1-like [Argiope bruennichi]|uniref:Calcium and integrin-binding protein 1 like protein n=1 Tax=Argiope bruennichi TaxID=94029 RepID=A0A8T0FN18_ARGBR|nr:calcium and integrin-binding protein 1-like [Argiope bruennichi]XP_055938401.1 calcium and integrin-binding protein 1-like [Argiope bruennichi]XP_055938402.1 calcium and integrin-binding protein 1-like [Argiope bruennichi]XP_055938403.1 calcium and integrin-binding protein 1-like [Argiope bruennichi]XP_055938404.1 calcium and integrin-binding protein 1-like [Argiope bruennichi]KAF8792587.1 Calcium and integrin-binding protein 1 like protein [Argiope bruennichi]